MPVEGIVVWRTRQKHPLRYLMVFGPGLIVMTPMHGDHVLDLAGILHKLR
jgi:ribonuclease BN (tRNA processing enzyme)